MALAKTLVHFLFTRCICRWWTSDGDALTQEADGVGCSSFAFAAGGERSLNNPHPHPPALGSALLWFSSPPSNRFLYVRPVCLPPGQNGLPRTSRSSVDLTHNEAEAARSPPASAAPEMISRLGSCPQTERPRGWMSAPQVEVKVKHERDA